MRNSVPAVLAGATLVASMTGTAVAAVNPEGSRCGFTSVTHPSYPDSQYGEVEAGPLVLADLTNVRKVVWGSVTCTIQLEEQHGTTANDQASLTGSVTPGVVWVAGTVSFEVGSSDRVYLCTEVDLVGGPTLYWDAPTDTWSTSAAVSCASTA